MGRMRKGTSSLRAFVDRAEAWINAKTQAKLLPEDKRLSEEEMQRLRERFSAGFMLEEGRGRPMLLRAQRRLDAIVGRLAEKAPSFTRKWWFSMEGHADDVRLDAKPEPWMSGFSVSALNALEARDVAQLKKFCEEHDELAMWTFDDFCLLCKETDKFRRESSANAQLALFARLDVGPAHMNELLVLYPGAMGLVQEFPETFVFYEDDTVELSEDVEDADLEAELEKEHVDWSKLVPQLLLPEEVDVADPADHAILAWAAFHTPCRAVDCREFKEDEVEEVLVKYGFLWIPEDDCWEFPNELQLVQPRGAEDVDELRIVPQAVRKTLDAEVERHPSTELWKRIALMVKWQPRTPGEVAAELGEPLTQILREAERKMFAWNADKIGLSQGLVQHLEKAVKGPTTVGHVLKTLNWNTATLENALVQSKTIRVVKARKKKPPGRPQRVGKMWSARGRLRGQNLRRRTLFPPGEEKGGGRKKKMGDLWGTVWRQAGPAPREDPGVPPGHAYGLCVSGLPPGEKKSAGSLPWLKDAWEDVFDLPPPDPENHVLPSFGRLEREEEEEKPPPLGAAEVCAPPEKDLEALQLPLVSARDDSKREEVGSSPEGTDEKKEEAAPIRGGCGAGEK